MKPNYSNRGVELYLGDSLDLLRVLPDQSVDLILADPPYSSGGMTMSDRVRDVSVKYQQTGTKRTYPPFTGDTRSQRGHGYWCALWLGECLRIGRPGSICGVFADWRQLPTTVDALEAGGWIYRGVVVWHKPAARPIKGRYASECEYLVWGTNGPRPLDGARYPGHYSFSVKQSDKHHVTGGKPTCLMRELVKICPAGGRILDPFAGSGTTGIAAVLEGREAILIEQSERYFEVACRRLSEIPEFRPSRPQAIACHSP